MVDLVLIQGSEFLRTGTQRIGRQTNLYLFVIFSNKPRVSVDRPCDQGNHSLYYNGEVRSLYRDYNTAPTSEFCNLFQGDEPY